VEVRTARRRIKVVHLVAGGLAGGAARGAYWLHKGLTSIDVDSWLLTDGLPEVEDPRVRYVALGPRGRAGVILRSLLEIAPTRAYPQRQHSPFSPGIAGYRFDRHPDVRDADIVHLHWINDGFVNVRDLSRIRKPIVWTLRDMWPITGGCHYSMGCERFVRGCGECPQLGSRRRFDLSWWGARRKLRNYPLNATFVAISRWLADEARRSSVMAQREVVTIANNVNCADFFSVDRECARRVVGISPGTKKVVLAGAQDLRVSYKGYDALVDALNHLNRDSYLILLFGRGGAQPIEELGFEVKHLGLLADTIALRAAYGAADVFVAPSRMEAFGKTLAEAMACGCPVVCFDATGPRDIVDHQVNGYRATPFDPGALAAGIEWVTEDADRWRALATAARAKVEREFDSPVVARRYAELYERVLAGDVERARPAC
jgi:glycosyltransferase involved in cell wall biosynthesis